MQDLRKHVCAQNAVSAESLSMLAKSECKCLLVTFLAMLSACVLQRSAGQSSPADPPVSLRHEPTGIAWMTHCASYRVYRSEMVCRAGAAESTAAAMRGNAEGPQTRLSCVRVHTSGSGLWLLAAPALAYSSCSAMPADTGTLAGLHSRQTNLIANSVLHASQHPHTPQFSRRALLQGNSSAQDHSAALLACKPLQSHLDHLQPTDNALDPGTNFTTRPAFAKVLDCLGWYWAVSGKAAVPVIEQPQPSFKLIRLLSADQYLEFPSDHVRAAPLSLTVVNCAGSCLAYCCFKATQWNAGFQQLPRCAVI